MKRGKSISPAEVDFWLDTDRYRNFLQDFANDDAGTASFSIDMVRLSSIRRAISNFVRILTRQNIPVYFNNANANVNFGGKTIYISANIGSKQDFDVAVGQALHEGAHTLKTDFDIVKIAWANVPHQIFALSDSKNIRRVSIEKFIHNTWNVIEDRFIDNFIFNEAPGYRGYYIALYDRFWNNPTIDSLLLDPDLFRYPSLDSYSFRITNFTNLNTDLMALPGLEDVAKIINISTIDRLTTTKDRINTAFEVVEVVLNCLDKQPLPKTISSPNQPKIADPSDYFGDESDEFGQSNSITNSNDNNGENDKDKIPDTEIDVGKKETDEISDILSGRNPEPDKPKENSDVVNKINVDGVDKSLQKQIQKVIESQKQFLSGELPKDALTEEEKSLLDLVEKHGIEIIQLRLPELLDGNDASVKVDCIVVQKMTKDLIFSGSNIFPLSSVIKIGNNIPEPPKDVTDAVKKGIQIGTKLGRKLKIRAESNPIKTIRKKFGKVHRRQLHEAAFDAEDLFYKTKIEKHNQASLHITVDASSSMSGPKWIRTMTAVVAISKAASMIDNVHVTISFRATQDSGSYTLPYVIMAYDSKIDKFSKIRNLFPYLVPRGFTPEGLAFGAIMNLFDKITPDEEDRFFLNLSDGEPYYNIPTFQGTPILYSNDLGTSHTKTQVDKIRKYGISILSYFIQTNCEKRDKINFGNSPNYKNFRKMYGKDAKFIDVESIVDLAFTMNELFLTRMDRKNP